MSSVEEASSKSAQPKLPTATYAKVDGGDVQQNARIYATIISTISDFAYLFDLQGRFQFINKPLLDLWGLTLEQAVGKNFFELNYPEALAEKLQRQIQQVIQTRARVVDETEYTNPAGDTGYYEYIFSPVLAADGTVEVGRGIDARHQRAKARR